MTSSPNTPLIRLENAAYQIDHCWLLRDISMDIFSKDIISIIGPNGAGKSTLVKLIVGLLPLSSGTKHVLKKDLKIAYVPQAMTIPRHLPMRVDDLIDATERIPKEDAKDALAQVELNKTYLKKYVKDLSGGELQRVLLARTLARKPDLMVLDEPLQGVEQSSLKRLHDIILQAKEDRGSAVVMISHDLNLVLAATDRVICLNGHICCAGEPKAITQHPEYQAIFGANTEALALYEHHHDRCEHQANKHV